MNQEHYNAVREAVIKANPEIRTKHLRCQNCGGLHGFCHCAISAFETERPIRLADVLLAHRGKYVPTQAYSFMTQVYEITNGEKAWNLRKDSLEDQPPELVEFLYTLLVGGEK